jgi:hypothetical protein
MIDADPIFIDPAWDDFHLAFDSPCRDAGTSAAVVSEDDFEGDPRITGGFVDMGADEFHPHLYHVGDVLPGAAIHVRVVGRPGTAPVRLLLGSGLLDPPRQTFHGDFYLELPIRWQKDLGAVWSNSVIILAITVPTVWQTGDQRFLQALVGPLGNPGSILTNPLTLTVE